MNTIWSVDFKTTKIAAHHRTCHVVTCPPGEVGLYILKEIGTVKRLEFIPKKKKDIKKKESELFYFVILFYYFTVFFCYFFISFYSQSSCRISMMVRRQVLTHYFRLQ